MLVQKATQSPLDRMLKQPTYSRVSAHFPSPNLITFKIFLIPLKVIRTTNTLNEAWGINKLNYIEFYWFEKQCMSANIQCGLGNFRAGPKYSTICIFVRCRYSVFNFEIQDICSFCLFFLLKAGSPVTLFPFSWKVVKSTRNKCQE